MSTPRAWLGRRLMLMPRRRQPMRLDGLRTKRGSRHRPPVTGRMRSVVTPSA